MPRLFVAVEVAQPVIDSVGAAIGELRDIAPDLRWVEPDKYHLTLVFLGSVEAELVPAVRDAVTAACVLAEPFSLALTGRVGTFRSGVLWAELAESPALGSLASALTTAVGGVVPLRDRDRPYSAHLTLARAPRGGRIPRALGDATVPAGVWSVDRVVLMESKLSPKGARYSVDTAFPLTS